jgi:hypothetical protein
LRFRAGFFLAKGGEVSFLADAFMMQIVDSIRLNSSPHRMPGRLELDQRSDLLCALHLVREPVDGLPVRSTAFRRRGALLFTRFRLKPGLRTRLTRPGSFRARLRSTSWRGLFRPRGWL